jgi:transcriptional regulator with XRE-family HTH domain
MSSLAQLLAAKIEADGLTSTGAAEKAGVSFPSFNAALKGKSVPNARSIDKYAAFLGISADEVRASSKGAASARGADRPAGKRGPGRPAAAGRRGRPRKGGAIDAGAALREVGAALERANEILGDELAVRVHGLSAKSRSVIESVLGSLA